MSMQIGVGLDFSLGLNFDQHRELAQEAARLGYSSVWTPAGLTHDSFQICAQWSMASRAVAPGGLATGISVVAVGLYSAPVLAQLAGTVGDLSGGRFTLGIGAGASFSDAYWRSIGMPSVPSIALMRDYVITIRKLLAGETVDYDGAAVKLHGIKLGFRPPHVPVYLGALGPQMLHLAGAHADGAALNWCSPEQVAWSRTQIAEGAKKAAAIRRRSASPSTFASVWTTMKMWRGGHWRAQRWAMHWRARAHPKTRVTARTSDAWDSMRNSSELEAKQAQGASAAEIAEQFPRELLRAVGYYGPASGAAAAFKRLATGLDTAIVRVVAARPGVESVLAVMRACKPG